MIARPTLLLGLFSVGAGVGSYVATVTIGRGGAAVAAASTDTRPESHLTRWLSLTPEQLKLLQAEDATFDTDRRRLQEEQDAARDALVAALANEAASDEEIRSKIDRALDAHGRLERRVADYLLKVRKHLTPTQRQRLFAACAEHVRMGEGRGYGGPPEDGGRGRGRGRGGPRWQQN
jgi:Spy/CpxP family protein refolding chaperone